MKPAANTLRPSLLPPVGDTSSSSTLSKDNHRKTGRAPRFQPHPIRPAPENTDFARYTKQVAEMLDRNQNAKQRAEAKRLAKEEKGKQRATEPLFGEKRRVLSSTHSEDAVDRANVSTEAEDSWDVELDEASLMDIEVDKAMERSSAGGACKAKPSSAQIHNSTSSRAKPAPSLLIPTQSKHPPTRPSPADNTRRSVSVPQDLSKVRSPASDFPPSHILPRSTAHTAARSRESSPAKAASGPKPPQSSQSRGPPALGMRRTNTHSGVASAFRPSQDIPMKQRGFRTPFSRPANAQTPSQAMSSISNYDQSGRMGIPPPNSFPVSERSPSPELTRGRPPQARPARSPSQEEDDDASPEADSSYGDISFDEDTLNEIMSQYD